MDNFVKVNFNISLILHLTSYTEMLIRAKKVQNVLIEIIGVLLQFEIIFVSFFGVCLTHINSTKLYQRYFILTLKITATEKSLPRRNEFIKHQPKCYNENPQPKKEYNIRISKLSISI